jgi:SAM-dependent methyltransferase
MSSTQVARMTSQRTTGIYAWTQIASLYNGFQSLLGAHFSRQVTVREYIRPLPGEHILDIGCGPGSSLPYLGDVRYVGLDLNPRHIAEAKRRFGDRGTFHCGPIASLAAIDDGHFDAILALGLLHHLEDKQVVELTQLAAQRLLPGGRLVTLDVAFTSDQHRIARMLARADGGRRVRTPEQYWQLVAQALPMVEVTVRHDLLRVPYTHCIMVARQSGTG